MTESEAWANMQEIEKAIPKEWNELALQFKKQTHDPTKYRGAIGGSWKRSVSGTPEKPYLIFKDDKHGGGPEICMGTKGGKYTYWTASTSLGSCFGMIDNETGEETDFTDYGSW
jgi:hypothetical protein